MQSSALLNVITNHKHIKSVLYCIHLVYIIFKVYETHTAYIDINTLVHMTYVCIIAPICVYHTKLCLHNNYYLLALASLSMHGTPVVSASSVIGALCPTCTPRLCCSSCLLFIQACWTFLHQILIMVILSILYATLSHATMVICPFLPAGWYHAFFVPYAIKQSPPLVFLDPMRCQTV